MSATTSFAKKQDGRWQLVGVSWLAGWLAGWENHLWHGDGWLHFLQQQQPIVWRGNASASRAVSAITAIAGEPERTGEITPSGTAEQK